MQITAVSRRRGLLAALALVVAVVSPAPASAADPLISQGKATTSSSAENGTFGPANAVDGNAGTRWSSAFSDPQWIQIDLGGNATVSQVVLNWETAYARAFQIQ